MEAFNPLPDFFWVLLGVPFFWGFFVDFLIFWACLVHVQRVVLSETASCHVSLCHADVHALRRHQRRRQGTYTCAQQAGWGKCSEDFMKGFCCKSCFKCAGVLQCGGV